MKSISKRKLFVVISGAVVILSLAVVIPIISMIISKANGLTAIKQWAEVLMRNDYIVETQFILGGIPSEWNHQLVGAEECFVVTSDTYKSIADIEGLLADTYTEQLAKEILNNPCGNGKGFEEKGNSLYIYPYRLSFCGDQPFKKENWDQAQVVIKSASFSTAEIEVKLPMESTTVTYGVTMKNENGKWLLANKVTDSIARG